MVEASWEFSGILPRRSLLRQPILGSVFVQGKQDHTSTSVFRGFLTCQSKCAINQKHISSGCLPSWLKVDGRIPLVGIPFTFYHDPPQKKAVPSTHRPGATKTAQKQQRTGARRWLSLCPRKPRRSNWRVPPRHQRPPPPPSPPASPHSHLPGPASPPKGPRHVVVNASKWHPAE